MTNEEIATAIGAKVVTWYAAGRFSRTKSARDTARQRAEAYGDCYRLITGTTETTQEIYNRLQKTLDRKSREG